MKIDGKDIKVLMVPGNHDIDHGISRSITPEGIRSLNDDERHSAFIDELVRMDSFFNYAHQQGCFFKAPCLREQQQVFTRKILHFSNGYRIEANLINTAPFSCDNDDGLHYLPQEALLNMAQPSDASISMVVMHHAPDWFPINLKRQMHSENKLLNDSGGKQLCLIIS